MTPTPLSISTQVSSAKPDAIFYAGYFAEAAPLVTELRSAGVTATFVAADGVTTHSSSSRPGRPLRVRS